jgi:hypothetical protein
MGGYLGKEPYVARPGAPELFQRPDTHWGTAGVMRIVVDIEQEDDDAPIIRITEVSANGMNRDTCLSMIMNGKDGFKQAGQVAVPKEIRIRRDSRTLRREAFLAIDEKGTLRDSHNWELLRDKDRMQIYNDPLTMWKHVSRMQLTPNVIR